jgi:oligopeptide transport system ATP-binding protein
MEGGLISMEKEILVKLDDLTHIYNGGGADSNTAVDHVNVEIYKGETFGLVGESGCGKTTTGKMIVKLLDISYGRILYKNEDISKIRGKTNAMEYRKNVQMIFQDPYASLDPRMKVKDIIGEGIRLHHLCKSEKDLEEQVHELLNKVGLLPEHATRYPHEFSGGQRQRIGIARALAVRPEFVVCDEPISALDVSVQAQIVNLLKRMQKESHLTYLFIAHDLSMVRYMSDRIGVMWKGRIVELGSAKEVYENPMHPYTKNLISSIPLPDPDIERTRKREKYQHDGEREGVWTQVGPGHYVLL